MIIGVGNGQFMLMHEMGTGVPLALSGDTQLSLAASHQRLAGSFSHQPNATAFPQGDRSITPKKRVPTSWIYYPVSSTRHLRVLNLNARFYPTMMARDVIPSWMAAATRRCIFWRR